MLALYAALALLLSWPLLPRIFTHVPGTAQWAFDESTFIWNIWYFKHALVDTLTSPLHSELIYYPLGIDLILYTYNFFHALLAQPLMLAVNLPFASNVSLLVSTVLSAYGTFLLVRYLLGRAELFHFGPLHSHSPIPPIVAGLLFAFASNRAIYAALGHYDMVTTQWIPLYALALLRSLDRTLTGAQRRKAAALAGLFFAFNGLAEMITALFMALFTIIVVIVYFGSNPQREEPGDAEPRFTLPSLTRLASALMITGVVAFVVWGPALVPILYQFLTDDFSLKGWGEAIPLSTDLLGWFTPTTLHPIFGGDLVAELRRVQLRALPDGGETGFRDLNTVFLGWTSLAVAVLGALAFRRRVRTWIWTSIVFGLFTLGPFLQINGEYRFDLDGVEATFPMPYALLHYLPIIKANRAPNRNSVVLMLGLAVLAGYGIYFLMRLTERWWSHRSALHALLPTVLAALIVFEHLTLPYPLSDARIPDVYAQITVDPDPVSVMHLPLGWRNSFGIAGNGPERTLLQYYQTAHGKPMLGGNISRAPDFKWDYFTRIDLFQALIDVQRDENMSAEARAAALERAKAQADELMYLYNVGYVLLMPPIPQRYPYANTWEAAWEFARETLPLEAEPFWAEDGIEAYRVIQPEGSDTFALDLGVAGTFPYRGEGWDGAETDTPYDTTAIWATDQRSRLFLPLRNTDDTASYTLSVRARPFMLPQSVGLRVNGSEFEAHTLTDDWQTVTWSVPGSALVDGLNRVELLWAETAIPREVNPGSRAIGTTGVELPVDAALTGFGEGGFIALFDEAGEQSDASAGRRGVNVTVLDPASGEVVDRVGFDTAANTYESDSLEAYLSQVQPGQIVLAVSHGDATAHLTSGAVEALRGVGADVTLDGLAGQAFAIIGVGGAEPGSAAVEVQPDSAYLRIGLNEDRRTLAGAVDWVEIE